MSGQRGNIQRQWRIQCVLSGGDPNGLVCFLPRFCVLWCWAWCWRMCCPCLVQEGNEIQKDVAECYKAYGGMDPTVPKVRAMPVQQIYLYYPAPQVVVFVWSYCINDKFIPCHKTPQTNPNLEFLAQVSQTKKSFCLLQKKLLSVLLAFSLSLSLLTGVYNFLVFILIQQFPSSRSKRRVSINNIFLLLLFKGHRMPCAFLGVIWLVSSSINNKATIPCTLRRAGVFLERGAACPTTH